MHQTGVGGRTAAWRAVAIGLAVALAALFTAATAPAALASCGAPANAIEAENCLPGNPPSDWDVSGAGDGRLQGYATDISVDQGGTVEFKVDSNDGDFYIDIYRMGYYQGNGARRVARIPASETTAVDQTDCSVAPTTGLIDCGNWSTSASWQVPAAATSGIYFAALVRADESGASHVPFIVRDDDGGSQMLFQTADTTWQAYNQYGGNSLYVGGPGSNPNRAYKVSYNRPFTTRGTGNEDWVFNAEYPMVRWMERNGYDVSYSTGVDTDRRGSELLEHGTFLSVGHDEYWSGPQRSNVEAARDAGVNLAFFSGNEVYWKTRWEDNHRTLVSYKETHAGAKIDPTGIWTGTFRDRRGFNPQPGPAENALTGTAFRVNFGTRDIRVPAADGAMRLWRNTSVATQAPGATATLAPDTLGYEWDEDTLNGERPAGLVRFSSTTASDLQILLDEGHTFGDGSATHHLTLYRDDNGSGRDALVFGAGTVQWSWGLDSNHDRGGGPDDVRMQQATLNLFADMGAQPASRQANLAPATASTDTVAPTTAVTSSSQSGGQVTVTGTAADTGGGRVGAVEVSLDGGSTWRPATGRENWTFTYTPSGSVDLRTRAADDSGNLGPPPSGGGTPPGGGGTPPAGGGTPPAGGGGSTGGGSTGSGGAGGSTGGSAGSTDRTAPRVRITPSRVRVSSKGTARLKVACPSSESRCTVRLRLLAGRKAIASGTLTVDGGKSRTAQLRLSRAARSTLARKRSQSVTVAATARDQAGNSTSTRSTIRLLAAARR